MDTFYKEAHEESEEESREKMLAAAMALHPRLGPMSPLGKLGQDMLNNIGQLIPREPFPQLQLLDSPYCGELATGISAENFNPCEPKEVNMMLLLCISLNFQGHHNETIFSGHVLPLAPNGILRIKTPSSKQGYYHACSIMCHGHDRFTVRVSWHDHISYKRYGLQLQAIDDQNRFIKQDTPQGVRVEIRAVAHAAPQMPPALQWPSSMPLVNRKNNESGFYYFENRFDLSPHDQRFVFSLWVAGYELFKAPIVDPADPTRRTIGCKHIDATGFEINAEVTLIKQDGRKYLSLDVYHLDMNLQRRDDICIQRAYLDDPEPLQRMRQDLLSGHVSFRVERLC